MLILILVFETKSHFQTSKLIHKCWRKESSIPVKLHIAEVLYKLRKILISDEWVNVCTFSLALIKDKVAFSNFLSNNICLFYDFCKFFLINLVFLFTLIFWYCLVRLCLSFILVFSSIQWDLLHRSVIELGFKLKSISSYNSHC